MAHQWGVPMEVPAQHPFDPLALLRLALAAGANRRVVEAVMHHAWRGGGARSRRSRAARDAGSAATASPRRPR
jgi:hypothetical protein